MNAIILCAGKGIRMKPITEYIPKPLLTIVDKTLLDIQISDLQQQDITAIGINLYHKADIIRDYIQAYKADNIVIAVEPELLGTGGVLTNFHHFDNDDLLVLSCDTIGNWDIQALTEFHRSHGGCATLVLSKHGVDRIVEIDDTNHIVKIGTPGTTNMYYDFAGTVLYSRDIFMCLPQQRTYSFIDLITHVIDQGREVYGFVTDTPWYNINTIEAYYGIHKEVLNNGALVRDIRTSGSCYIHPSSTVETERLDGFVTIGAHCSIGHDVVIHNTIVLANSTIKHGEYRNSIVSDNFCVKVT